MQFCRDQIMSSVTRAVAVVPKDHRIATMPSQIPTPESWGSCGLRGKSVFAPCDCPALTRHIFSGERGFRATETVSLALSKPCKSDLCTQPRVRLDPEGMWPQTRNKGGWFQSWGKKKCLEAVREGG